jgi:hypothetical protein
MMKNSFASVKTFAFRYRLNLAIERAEELGSCFISVGHKRRFCEGIFVFLGSKKQPLFPLYLFPDFMDLNSRLK